MLERGKNERGVIEMVDTESLVPEGHMLRQVDGAVDFERLYEIVEPLCSAEEGRKSIDPVVLFKIVLLQHLDGNASLRGTLRRAETDVAYRWFLGYTLREELPHFSTVSYNQKEAGPEEEGSKKAENGNGVHHGSGLRGISQGGAQAVLRL